MKNFLLFCSGVKRDILALCPTEENKYVGLGGAVLITSVLSVLSMGTALDMAFHLASPYKESLALFWGVAIFNLDRWLISSARRQETRAKEVVAFLPRLVMALVFGAIISEPLILNAFSSEIESQLARNQAAARAAAQRQADANPLYQQMRALEAANRDLRGQVEARAAQRDILYRTYIEEIEGVSGSGKVGKGPAAREKRERLAQADRELAAFRREMDAKVGRNEARVNQIQMAKDAELRELDQRSGEARGLLARMEALDQITASSATLALAHFLLFLAIMLLDCLPVLGKLIQSFNPHRPYDALLDAAEGRVEQGARVQSEDALAEAEADIAIARYQHHLRSQIDQENQQRLRQRVADAQYALGDQIITAWEERERDRIAQNMDDYIGALL